MKKLILIGSLLTLSACGSLTDPNSLNRWVDEATYKHYPNLSEAKRADCRAKADPIYWEKAAAGPMGPGRTLARIEAGNAFEKCMENR